MKFCKRAFIALLLCVSMLAPVAVSAMEPGTVAPGFTLKSVQGEEVSLADYKGRLVLLKLGTTWCPTCKEMSAEIDKIGAFLKEREVVVLEVFVQDSAAMIEKYLGDAEHPMTFQALLDDGQVYKAYNVYLIPRLLVVDAEQSIRFDSVGRNVLAEDIAAMVKEFGPPALTGGAS
jgi:peroxiredoxin